MKRKYTIYGMIMVVVLAFSSCQLGKHYARPELNLPQQLDSTEQDTLLLPTGNGGNFILIPRCKHLLSVLLNIIKI